MNTLIKNLLILTFLVSTVNASSIATVDEQKVLSEYIAFNQAREKVLASVVLYKRRFKNAGRDY